MIKMLLNFYKKKLEQSMIFYGLFICAKDSHDPSNSTTNCRLTSFEKNRNLLS